ncbi:hypothetical protein CHS0354_025783 [Potamilus streckersoni]|uniref:SIS domain-containing protein n=1 Tax=Potamilus streckersoni TaxID=2493646 RepID=A0AAE0WBP2_9BIVA|nr:hypothetical protein CHS0354_025783 [Potamilus streckersoni]
MSFIHAKLCLSKTIQRLQLITRISHSVETNDYEMSHTQPITEANNTITTDIDVATAEGIVTLLRKCDAEIFDGWEGHKGLFHKETMDKLSKLAILARDMLQNPSGYSIVLSGCGTSGRLAFITARSFNERLKNSGKEPIYDYLIAGGDKALFTSQEAPEDDPHIGIKMLRESCEGKKKVLYIGITCGLSAPFVAGQLDFCLQHLDKFTPVLLGFNPTYLARNLPIEKWNKTFLQVVKELEAAEHAGKGFILNPVVGPEPITGSSRMKSGSATKILLETIFTAAHSSAFNPEVPWDIETLFRSYQAVYNTVYSHTESVGKLVAIAGDSLQNGGSIYYIGYDTLGLMGMTDASECPPTYGATLDDVRGFIASGYNFLRNKEGDLSSNGKYFRISINDFEKDILPSLKDRDLVICLNTAKSLPSLAGLKESRCKRVMLTFTELPDEQLSKFDFVISLCLPIGDATLEPWQQLHREIATKWVLNAVTTGAHVLKGKVFQNIMVDLKVSNNKLFHRAVGIIEGLGKTSKEHARMFLLRSIYHTEHLTPDQLEAPIAQHIKVASSQNKIVPVALVAAILNSSIENASLLLDSKPVIRVAILQALHSQETDLS